ncbi:MAG: hypothetical protein ACPG77_21100 [Nannocystaceae bacterium]
MSEHRSRPRRPTMDPARARRMARRHSQWLAKRIRGGFARLHSLLRRPLLAPRATPEKAPVKLTAARSREAASQVASQAATRVMTALRRSAALIWRMLVVCLRQVIAHRRVVLGGCLRLGWWGALVLLVTAGPSVFEPTSARTLEQALPLFYVGVGLCAAVLLVAASRHLRWAAAGLALAHGTLAVVVLTVLGTSVT